MTEQRNALLPDKKVLAPMPLQSVDSRGAMVPTNMGEALECAKAMSSGRFSVPAYLNGNPGDCLRIVEIAVRTGLSMFMLADQSYLVEGRGGEKKMAFQAQAIHAIVLASGVLDGDLALKTEGEGEGEGENMKCTVTGKRVGGSVHTETYYTKTIKPKNSPIWQTQPRQQLGYYAERAWCRLHAPDAIMGLVAREDPPLEGGGGQVVDVTPSSDLDKVNAKLGVTLPPATEAEYQEVQDDAPTNEAATQPPQEPEAPPQQEDPGSGEGILQNDQGNGAVVTSGQRAGVSGGDSGGNAGDVSASAGDRASADEARAQDESDFIENLKQELAACASMKDVDNLVATRRPVVQTLSEQGKGRCENFRQMRLAELRGEI